MNAQKKPSDVLADIQKSESDKWSKLSDNIMDQCIQPWKKYNNVMKEYLKQYSEITKKIVKTTDFLRKIERAGEFFRDAFSKGIQNFDYPEKYDSSKFDVEEWLESQAFIEAKELLHKFTEGPFFEYKERYDYAYYCFTRYDWILPIFIFTSIQDGLMTFLCEKNKVEKKGCRGYCYTSKQKREELMKHYGDYNLLIKDNTFQKNLKIYYAHRNEIMHGGINVHFDKNIAIISLVFLVFTYNIVLNKTIE